MVDVDGIFHFELLPRNSIIVTTSSCEDCWKLFARNAPSYLQYVLLYQDSGQHLTSVTRLTIWENE